MFEILQNEPLNPTVSRMVVKAPRVAAKAQPGQFIILRVDDEGERIPLTVADIPVPGGSVKGCVYDA